MVHKLGSEIMKRLMGLVLAALLLAVFVFEFRRVLARAPEGGSPVFWILAFAVVVGLIALVGGVLRAVNFSRLRQTLRRHPKSTVTLSLIIAVLMFALAKPYPMLSPFLLGLCIAAALVFVSYFSWWLVMLPVRWIKSRG